PCPPAGEIMARPAADLPMNGQGLAPANFEAGRTETLSEADFALLGRQYIAGKPAIYQPGNRRADDGCQPEQPQLSPCPAAGEDSRTSGARRVHRSVRDRNAYGVD